VGQKLAYIWGAGRRSAAKLLSKDEARRIAAAGAAAAAQFLTRDYVRHRGVRDHRVVCFVSNQRGYGYDGCNKGRK
jgi:hypothetical protein